MFFFKYKTIIFVTTMLYILLSKTQSKHKKASILIRFIRPPMSLFHPSRSSSLFIFIFPYFIFYIALSDSDIKHNIFFIPSYPHFLTNNEKGSPAVVVVCTLSSIIIKYSNRVQDMYFY